MLDSNFYEEAKRFISDLQLLRSEETFLFHLLRQGRTDA